MDVCAMANPDQFTSLYTKHERQLYRFLASMLGQPADAEDLLQETAKKLWREFESYDAEKPFLPWACAIARYEVLSFGKRQKVKRKYFSDEVAEALAEEWRDAEADRDLRALALEQCIEALPASDRRLLADRYAGEGSLKDLAERSGQTPNALYKSLQRIREMLFDCVTRKVALEH